MGILQSAPLWIIVIAVIGGLIVGHIVGRLLSIGLSIIAIGFVISAIVAYNNGAPLPDVVEAGLDWVGDLWQTIKGHIGY